MLMAMMTGDWPVTRIFKILWNHTDNLTMGTGNFYVHFGCFRLAVDDFLAAVLAKAFFLAFRPVF